MNATQLNGILDRFANAHSVSELNDCVRTMLKDRLVKDAREDPRFRAGVHRCFEVLAPPADRLLAISLAYRLAESSKPVMSAVRPIASQALAAELPPLELLSDGEDRYYASLSTQDADYPWVIPYVANAIAREETAETARSNLAARLLSSENLSDSLRLLARNLATARFPTEKPEESAARRLRRVILAIRPTLVGTPISPGDDLGPALRAFFLSPFRATPRMPEGRVAQELASECFALVHDTLRTQISIVADPAIYQALLVLKEWVPSTTWGPFVTSDSHAGAVRAALEGAIVLLAKQGVTDTALLEALSIFFGNREGAVRRAAEISKENTGLEASVREWLTRFGRTRTTPVLSSMSEAKDANLDESIAHLVLLADSVRASLREVRQKYSETVDVRAIDQLAAEVSHLASARQLSTRLAAGDIVEYSQHAHELAGGHRLGVRLVRVIQPAVERQGDHGLATVVRKALVEAIENSNGQ